MIVLLKVVTEELKKEPHKIRDQEVTARLEVSPPKKKPLAEAHALFYKGLNAVKGDESQITVVYGKLQISFFVGGAMAANLTPEGEGLADEGWIIKPAVFSAICTEFSEAFLKQW